VLVDVVVALAVALGLDVAPARLGPLLAVTTANLRINTRSRVSPDLQLGEPGAS
jgi:hypothetical protein